MTIAGRRGGGVGRCIVNINRGGIRMLYPAFISTGGNAIRWVAGYPWVLRHETVKFVSKIQDSPKISTGKRTACSDYIIGLLSFNLPFI